ncbi:MAG: hypothetical protein OXH76_06245 [Boseongicola sp.]|nr:hypothetical protein [Boseongicola sp.]
MADKTGALVAALGPVVGFRELAPGVQPDTGKVIGSDVRFDVEGKGAVRFAGEKAVSSFIFDSDERFNWWYTRFGSRLEIELSLKGGKVDAEGHAIREHMDFRGEPVGKG